MVWILRGNRANVLTHNLAAQNDGRCQAEALQVPIHKHEKRITAFELWCWRRVLRISWTEYKTNVWARQKIGVPEQNGLLEPLKKRKLAKYGHWKRRSEGLLWL